MRLTTIWSLPRGKLTKSHAVIVHVKTSLGGNLHSIDTHYSGRQGEFLKRRFLDSNEVKYYRVGRAPHSIKKGHSFIAQRHVPKNKG